MLPAGIARTAATSPSAEWVVHPQAVVFCNIRHLRDMNLRNLADGARHWQTMLSPSEV